jgi:hypothetical protein
MPYTPGDFSFEHDEQTRLAFEDMWIAITTTETWSAMVQDPGEGGFCWSRSPHIVAIHTALNDRVGHSGASLALTMRTMQRLARIGWDAFVAERTASTTH